MGALQEIGAVHKSNSASVHALMDHNPGYHTCTKCVTWEIQANNSRNVAHWPL